MLTASFLFAGGGGDCQGAIAANYKPLWAVEYDKYAAAVYRYRFPSVQLIESDITELDDDFIRSLAVPNVVIGGSPCPDFSMSGSRSGLKGDHGQLFFEFVRFLRLLQCQAFIFENVKGLLASNEGNDIKQVLRAFGELGYECVSQVRNADRWVPQNRERIYIVGIHSRYSMPQSIVA